MLVEVKDMGRFARYCDDGEWYFVHRNNLDSVLLEKFKGIELYRMNRDMSTKIELSAVNGSVRDGILKKIRFEKATGYPV